MLLAHSQGRSVRSVGGWSSCRHGDSRLFVRSFARGHPPSQQLCVCVCVCVCVRVRVACDVGVMVNSVLILSPSRYCTTTTTNSTRCGIYSVWFRVLSFGFWGVGVRWLIHLILSPSRYCTTTTTNNTRCGISIYLYIYISIGRHIPGRIYIFLSAGCVM